MPDPKRKKPVILPDYKEKQSNLENVKGAQKTLEDRLWFTYEYKAKNDSQNYGADFPEDQRERFGFNRSAAADDTERGILKNFINDITAKVTAGTLDDYRQCYRAFGSMHTRSVVITGKTYDTIAKALGEETPNLDEKTYYLYAKNELGIKASGCFDFTTDVEAALKNSLRDYIEENFDYKTITFREFAERMGLDYEK